MTCKKKCLGAMCGKIATLIISSHGGNTAPSLFLSYEDQVKDLACFLDRLYSSIPEMSKVEGNCV